MIFSVTEMTNFQRCRRKWYYGSFNGLAKTQIRSSPALRMGSVWHKGCEWWLEPTAHDYPVETLQAMGPWFSTVPFYVLMRIAGEQSMAAVEALIKEKLDRPLNDEEKATFYDEINLLEAMAMNYEQVWGSPLPEGFVNLKAEQTTVVDIPGTEWWTCPGAEWHIDDGSQYSLTRDDGEYECRHVSGAAYVMDKHTHQLEATLDGLIMREDTGMAYILERKTYGTRPKQEVLQKTEQFVAYMWVLKQLGIPCGGVSYDGAWKRAAPAKGKGLTMDDLFLRYVINHSDSEVESYGEYIAQKAIDAAAVVADPKKAYPYPRWDGCWDCDLTNKEGNGICDMMDAKNTTMVDFLLSTEYTDRPVGNRELVWPGVLEA